MTSADQTPKARPNYILIKSRRSCIGCGLRPGHLYGNGLCERCQFPNKVQSLNEH